MDEAFWLDRWQHDRIGFHEEDVNPRLVAHAGEMPWPDGGRIFVPLCGKSGDLIWLRDHGQRVIGVELASIACRALFEEHDEDFQVRDAGRHRLYVGDAIEVFCGDFFALDAQRLGKVDGVYDRASLVALPPELRASYAEHLRELVTPGTVVFLQTLEYAQEEMKGPPFSVGEDELRALYAAAFDLEDIEIGEWVAPPGKFAERGISRMRECCWMLTRKEDA